MGWGDFVRRRLLDPLEMKATVLTSPEAEAAADHASPHRKNRLGRPEVIPYYRIETPEPAGSVYSTARDLATWARFQLGDGTFAGKRLVSAATLAETHTPQSVIRLEGSARTLNPETIQLNYGMGWVVQDSRGRLLVAHAGAIDGFRAHITLVPDAKLGIVLLNNLHETRMNLALSNNLVDLFLGLGKRDWNAYYLEQVHKDEAAAQERVRQRMAERHHDTHPSREASAYVGRYEDPAYGSAEVTFEDGTLVWQWSTFRCPLRHFHYDTFLVENDVLGHPLAFFTLAADGEVASMKVGDMLEVEFKKVKPKSPRGSP